MKEYAEWAAEENCTITDDEYEVFVDGWGNSPCSEYGMCENCPWSITYVEEREM